MRHISLLSFPNLFITKEKNILRFIIILWICIPLLEVQGQAINIKFEVVTKKRKTYWHIQGKVNLPDRVILAANLIFKKARIRGSKRLIKIKNKRFTYVYGPISSKILHGRYALRLAYSKTLQFRKYRQKFKRIRNFKRKKYFRVGTKANEYSEVREYRTFFQQYVKDLDETLVLFNKGKKQFLYKKFDPYKVGQWFKDLSLKFDKLAEGFSQRSYPVILAPHVPRMMMDVKKSIQLLEYVIFPTFVITLQENKKRIPERYRKYVRYKKNRVESYEKSLKKLKARIKQNDIFKKLRVKELGKDLRWFNSIYKNIVVDKEKILRNQTFFYKHHTNIKAFRERIGDYSYARFVKKQKGIITTLKQMHSYIKDLLRLYRKSIQSRKEEKIRRKLQSLFKEVFEFVLKDKKASREAKSFARKSLIKGLEKLLILWEGFSSDVKNIDMKVLRKFQEQLAEVDKEILQQKKRYPNTIRQYKFTIYSINKALRFYEKNLQSGKEDQRQMKEINRNIRVQIYYIRKILKKMKKKG